jgi:protein phosphatase
LTTALGRYTAAALTDRGRKRPANEDAFGLSPEHGLYVVCDGMGGAAAGEVASSMAVEELMRRLAGRPELPGCAMAEEAISAVNDAIIERSQRDQKLSGMGTTMVALLAGPEHVWILNVGDSRGYRLRGRRLEQITRDHSVVDEQVRAGRMSRRDAERSPLRNMITRALGTQESVVPDTFTLEPEPGDLFLLCSDGLTRDLKDAEIERTLAQMLSNGQPLEEQCERLIDAANKAGGGDNITCLLVHVGA